MISGELAQLAQRLAAEREPVRDRDGGTRPTADQRASRRQRVVLADGAIEGFVGGVCATRRCACTRCV